MLGIGTLMLPALLWVSSVAGQATPRYRTVCYMASWARYRPEPVRFSIQDLASAPCTHFIFSFAYLDASGRTVVAADPQDPELYRQLTNLKKNQAQLKVMLAIGGWTMGSEEFTKTVSSAANMQSAASSIVDYLRRHNFDGVDIDWEYPADRGSPPADKQRFTQFLQVLRKAFDRESKSSNCPRLLLSAAINPLPYRVQQSYEIKEIVGAVDFLNLMTYDMHGPWDGTVGHHSSLYTPTGGVQTASMDYVLNEIVKNAVDKKKLNLGLAFYGRSLRLADPGRTSVGSPISGPGAGGDILREEGILAYFEVCKLLKQRNAIRESGRLPGTQSPYVVDGSRWTGYDDSRSIQEKVSYAMQKGLGGVFMWTIDMDDFNNSCRDGSYPLITAIQRRFQQGR